MTTTDSVQTIPNTNSARRSHSGIPENGENYVRSGMAFTPEWDDDELHVDRGEVLAAHNGTLYVAEVDSRDDTDTVSLQASAAHDVYYDVGNEAIVATTGSGPSEPRLRIGTVDTSAQTYDDSVNRRRDDAVGAFQAEDLGITETDDPREEGAGITRTESFDGRMESSQFPSGSAIPLGLPQRIVQQNVTTTATSAESVYAGTDRDPGLVYGAIPTPPNTVPILAINAHYQSQDSGEEYELRVETGANTDPILHLGTRGDGTAENYGFDMCYLNEQNATTGDDSNFWNGRWEIKHSVTGGSTGGTLYADSTLQLWMEVL